MLTKPTYTEERSWGSFDQLSLNEPVTVKILNVKENSNTSLQTHEKREEFWRVISGNPILKIGDDTIEANPGEEFVVPMMIKHQIIANKGPVSILEVSRGFFNENDITRYTNN